MSTESERDKSKTRQRKRVTKRGGLENIYMPIRLNGHRKVGRMSI